MLFIREVWGFCFRYFQVSVKHLVDHNTFDEVVFASLQSDVINATAILIEVEALLKSRCMLLPEGLNYLSKTVVDENFKCLRSFTFIQQHQGQITLESAPGEGTTVHLVLPTTLTD